MTQALIAKPVFNDELGLLMFRPAERDLQAFRSMLDKNTVLLQPAPEELAGNRPGLVNRPGRPEGGMSYGLALEFFRHGAVAQVLGCPDRLKTWQGRPDKCAIHGDDCAGGVTWCDGLYPVPLCWHHDNAHRKAPVKDITLAADRRVLAFGLAQVAEFVGRNRASEVSVAELAWWAAAHGVHELLPEGLARTALGRQFKSPDRNTGWGWKDTDARYDTRDHIADLTKMVKPIKFVVDPEPATVHMARPKLKAWSSEEYRQFVLSLPCSVTGSKEGVGLIMVNEQQLRGCDGCTGDLISGIREHDFFIFPLCRELRRSLEQIGPRRWEQKHGMQQLHVIRTLNKAASLGVFG